MLNMSVPPAVSGRPPLGPTGPAGVPTGNPGLAAAGLAKLRESIKIMEEILPTLQPGTDVHKAVLNAISSVSKHVPASGEMAGVQMTTLRDLQQQAQSNGMLDAVMRAAGHGGGAAQPAGPPMGGA